MKGDDLELDASIYAEVKRFCSLGDSLVDAGKPQEALKEYNNAWKLIPHPPNEWEASTWVLGAIGDTCFQVGDYLSARKALDFVMSCPGAIGNPFLHLRRGQVLFEMKELDGAADELIRAYMGAGDDIFSNEEPKYYQFLKQRAEL